MNNDDYGHLEPLPYSKLFVFQGQDNDPAKWKIAHLKSFEATYFSFGSKPDFAQGRATSVLPPMSDADGETAVPRVSGGKVTLRHQQGQKLIHTPDAISTVPIMANLGMSFPCAFDVSA